MAKLNRDLALHADIINNKNRRLPICLCIDVSSKAKSHSSYLETIETCINSLINSIRNQPSMKAAVDLFIMAYAENPKVIKEFSNISNAMEQFTLPVLEGEPHMFTSLDLCLRKLQQRLNEYKNASLSRHHPIVVIISSGYTNESSTVYEKKRENWKQLESSRIISILPILNGDGDSELLRKMTNDNKIAIAADSSLSSLLTEIGNSVEELSNSTSEAYRNLKANMISWSDVGGKQ